MASSAAYHLRLPFGRTHKESQKLLDQTSTARLITQPMDFSGIDDLSEILSESLHHRQTRSRHELRLPPCPFEASTIQIWAKSCRIEPPYTHSSTTQHRLSSSLLTTVEEEAGANKGTRCR